MPIVYGGGAGRGLRRVGACRLKAAAFDRVPVGQRGLLDPIRCPPSPMARSKRAEFSSNARESSPLKPNPRIALAFKNVRKQLG